MSAVMEVGARIYYDKETGIVIQEVGECSGVVVETTTKQDFAGILHLLSVFLIP
ncbi:hypothetical protein [Paenibacillus illinoisensis]|uniref:hypothetical protein n=1 Tax=Paenibacillus illinoisensis TaxID=59845 RepID=UPI001C8E1623|nr:hypothetical protein [Paenibacillus illinoisensis]